MVGHMAGGYAGRLAGLDCRNRATVPELHLDEVERRASAGKKPEKEPAGLCRLYRTDFGFLPDAAEEEVRLRPLP